MQTHPDSDVPSETLKRLRELFGEAAVPGAKERVEALEAKACEMVREESSTITAGKPGGRFIAEIDTPHGYVKRLPDDPLCLRISIGEGHEIPGSRYVVIRGHPPECLELLEQAVMAMKIYIRRAHP